MQQRHLAKQLKKYWKCLNETPPGVFFNFPVEDILEYKLVLDNSVINDYTEFYFSQHPRAKKKPIDRPIQPSLNQILILPRIQMNDLKQKWKHFAVWWINRLGLQDLRLDKFEMEVGIYMPTKRRFDLDNHGNCKLILDGFTESGFIIDDDCNHLTKMILYGGYDKDNPRTEFIFRTIE